MYPVKSEEDSLYMHFFLTFMRLLDFQIRGHSDDPDLCLVDVLHNYWQMGLIMMGELLLLFHLFQNIFRGRVAQALEGKIYCRLVSCCSICRNQLRELQISLGETPDSKYLFLCGGNFSVPIPFHLFGEGQKIGVIGCSSPQEG